MLEDPAPRTADQLPPLQPVRAPSAGHEQSLARELRSSALLLGLSFGLTAVVVTAAQVASALLGP